MPSPSPSPSPTPTLASDVEHQLLRAAYRRLRLSVVMTIGVTLGFVGLLWPYFAAPQMRVWLVALLATSVARLWLSIAFGKEAPAPASMPHWRRMFWFGAVAAGLAWSVGPMMLMTDASGVGMALLTGTLLSVCAVAMNSLAAQRAAMQAFLVTALAPAAVAAATHGGAAQRVLALILGAGMAALIVVGRRSNQAMRELLQTQADLGAALARADAARVQAQAASMAKTRFLANMSHELRTPLNAVIGAAQLLRAGAHAPERDAHLVDAIQRSGTNLLGLIESILDLSRIEAGEMVMHRADFHLVECIEGALSGAALAAHAKGLRLACVVDAEMPAWRHGDAARLRQLVLNLLGNAVKFTERGEVLVRVAAGSAKDGVSIQISDTGVGIGEASLPHIFNPFRQADDGADRRFGGTGLGLAIVRQLAQAMGGECHVNSTLGVGSRFVLDLPLPPAQVPPGEPAALGHRVAYVEPHDPSAEALQALLQRLGCQAVRCHSAAQLRQWLAAVGAQPGPWVLLDIDEVDAGEFIDQIVDLVAADRLVGVSANVSPMVDSALDGQHLTRQLVKPVTRSALVSRLGQLAGAVRSPLPPVALMSAAEAETMVHVLVVEDDELNRFIVSGMLDHAGCRVSVARDGREALTAIAHSSRIDLVLLDWQMPDMDGLEVARRLRAGAAGPAGLAVPIVALTANAFAEDRAACLGAGMNDYLTKPVLAANLMAAVKRWTAQPVVKVDPNARPKTWPQARPQAQPDPQPDSAVDRAPEPFAAVRYDPSVLAALPMVADGSEPGYAQELLAMFLATKTSTIEQLERALLINDQPTLLRLMHTLKSTSTTVGAIELAQLAAAQESALRLGAAPPPELAQQLQAGFARLAEAIAAHQRQLATID